MRTALLMFLISLTSTACTSSMNPFAPEASTVPNDLSAQAYQCVKAYASTLGGEDVVDALLARLRSTALREGISVEEALKRELRNHGSQPPPACSYLQQ